VSGNTVKGLLTGSGAKNWRGVDIANNEYILALKKSLSIEIYRKRDGG
jgi:hypothetical protein